MKNQSSSFTSFARFLKYATPWRSNIITATIYSIINNYTASNRKIETSFTSDNNLISGHTSYILLKQDNKSGTLRTSNTIYPSDGSKLSITIGYSIIDTLSSEFYLTNKTFFGCFSCPFLLGQLY